MERRNFIAALIAAPALGMLAGCASDSTGDSVQTSDTSDVSSPAAPVDAPPPTAPAPSTDPAEAPTPSDVPVEGSSVDVLLSYTTPGGFTTREFAFQMPPIAILTGDGTLLTLSGVPDGAPAPLLQQHRVQSVTPAGVDALLAAAESAGLFADVGYASEDGLLIADAPTSMLTITAGGTTYTHEAYALGIGGPPGSGGTETTPERQALLDFLTALGNDPASIFGADNLGEPTVYEPDAYQISVMSMSGTDIQSDAVIVDWPSDSGIDLSTAPDCAEVERAAIGDLFDDAVQFTFFRQDGEVYSVTPRPAYPGSSC